MKVLGKAAINDFEPGETKMGSQDKANFALEGEPHMRRPI
jgi:hypothetical protein